MKIFESGENYLETILMLQEEKGSVRAIDIVNKLGFSKPSVSVALKHLEENGYINRDNDGVIRFEEKGKKIAESIYERHEVLTAVFMNLGVREEIAREDACKIEHDISEETFQCIKEHIKTYHQL